MSSPPRPRRTPHPEKAVDLLGLRSRYIDVPASGQEEGPPLLLLHGHASRLEEYDALVPLIGKQRRVIVLDLPGCGEADKPADRAYTLSLYQDYALALLDHLEIDELDLAGGSLGGNLTLRLGARQPERFRKLAAWAPAGAWQPMKRWQLLAQLMRRVPRLFWPAWPGGSAPDSPAVCERSLRSLQTREPRLRGAALAQPTARSWALRARPRGPPGLLDSRFAHRGNEGSRGGTVTVDGSPVGGTLGSLPIRVPNLPPGRHQVRVEREGYVAFEQWVEVAGGQTVRVTAMLERMAPDTGSILVDCDVRGAAIFIDGRDTGRQTNTVLDDIAIGTHEIEIRMEGMEPFRQTVLVQRGARAEIHATIRPAAPTAGRLTVIISPAEAAGAATVLIDSAPLPTGIRTRSDLEAGTHVVQVTAPGFVEASSTVTITAGQASTVEIRLEAVRGEPSDINLQASVPGATITVDGEDHTSPYVADETEGGTHSVVVRAAGFTEVAFTCSTVNGTSDAGDCQRTVELEPLQVRLRAETTSPTREPATLYIDDREVSTLPYEGRIPWAATSSRCGPPGTRRTASRSRWSTTRATSPSAPTWWTAPRRPQRARPPTRRSPSP
jgi:pimeloyl-ACP methyl ester carboxylesterase